MNIAALNIVQETSSTNILYLVFKYTYDTYGLILF